MMAEISFFVCNHCQRLCHSQDYGEDINFSFDECYDKRRHMLAETHKVNVNVKS